MAGHLRAALAALREGSAIRRILIAYGCFCLVEFSAWVAVLLYAYEIGGASLAGIALVAQLVPAIVLVPVLGGVGDRVPRARALPVAYLIVAVTAGAVGLGIALGAAVIVVIACAIGRTVSTTFSDTNDCITTSGVGC